MSDEIKMPDIREPDEEDLLDSSIKLLNPKQQRFVHMYLSGQYKISEMAELLHMSQNGVRLWLKKPEIRKIIDEYQAEEDEIVKQGLKALQLKALQKMADLIDSKIDGIAYQAARDILDRNGKKAPTKQEVNVEIYTFEKQMVDAIKQAGASDEYIEAEYTVIDKDK
jgi:predicted DNA-binding protein YlxM (UPF0122 family)